MRKLEPYDYSSEIAMELDQLIALGELIRKVEDPPETREGFFLGLGDMIAGYADRIKEMVEPTYIDCFDRGKDSTATGQANPRSPQPGPGA